MAQVTTSYSIVALDEAEWADITAYLATLPSQHVVELDSVTRTATVTTTVGHGVTTYAWDG